MQKIIIRESAISPDGIEKKVVNIESNSSNEIIKNNNEKLKNTYLRKEITLEMSNMQFYESKIVISDNKDEKELSTIKKLVRKR